MLPQRPKWYPEIALKEQLANPNPNPCAALTTAHFLTARLEVSECITYRDVADLQYQGVPIEGDAGVGYRLGSGFDLPPLMFTQEEASALAAWCEALQNFRVFRVDRFNIAEVLDERFAHGAGRTLADFLRTVKKR